ncbi:hypothetical protein Daura_13610 [Dactylosporangium aurantiacum]|uniref:Uncharacterized protein n=1 Tax=Dactylosporangium aurantiacum TaxID=35754 RepID=A0A9Q9IK89_9ACTN|nr:hypothetical protein [Dactylosporangium aurantiacum]MDG6105551.1 hypothetical protein [Dactylosporangium aurantiacum]UWZ57106.1 hypothetical protein Daura_13610 [Dactylosporangium aurantiacum]
MATLDVRNDSGGWLVLWLEPWGEDRWLRPGETFHVRSDYDGPAEAFEVERFDNDDDRAAGIENIAVYVNEGAVEVTDSAGTPLECGHQRPDEVGRKWDATRPKLEHPIPAGGPRRRFYAERGLTVTDRPTG